MESKIYLGRPKFWTPELMESKIYLGRLVQNKLVYNDEREAKECLLGRGSVLLRFRRVFIAGRGASRQAFPRRAWEREITVHVGAILYGCPGALVALTLCVGTRKIKVDTLSLNPPYMYGWGEPT